MTGSVARCTVSRQVFRGASLIYLSSLLGILTWPSRFDDGPTRLHMPRMIQMGSSNAAPRLPAEEQTRFMLIYEGRLNASSTDRGLMRASSD